MVTIQASDDPYGVFSFPAAFRPVHVTEDVMSTDILVSRLFGTQSRVVVQFVTLSTPPQGSQQGPCKVSTKLIPLNALLLILLLLVLQQLGQIT